MSARDNPRFRHLASHLHSLGERPTMELLAELADAHGPDVRHRLERYARLPRALIEALDGRDMTPARPVSAPEAA